MVHILALGGDGIGPEILNEGLRVAQHIACSADIDLTIDHDLIHGACYEKHGVFCTKGILEKAFEADAILVGAVGGPQWDHIRMPGGAEEQDGLMYLRHHLQSFLGLRPACSWPSLIDKTPFQSEIVAGTDILILREMCGGAMFAKERGQRILDGQRQGFDLTAYHEEEIRRFAIGGFECARRRKKYLVSCDKSNVMESYKLWRSVVTEVAQDYPDVSCEHMFADNCGYQMIMRPRDFDVVLCCNQIGDLFSDLTASYAGSLGMLPSACLLDTPREQSVKGIYESTSGSAPDIAGLGIANPIGMILSVGMMFEYSLCRPDLNAAIISAVDQSLRDGCGTKDIGGNLSCAEMTDCIVERLFA